MAGFAVHQKFFSHERDNVLREKNLLVHWCEACLLLPTFENMSLKGSGSSRERYVSKGGFFRK